MPLRLGTIFAESPQSVAPCQLAFGICPMKMICRFDDLRDCAKIGAALGQGSRSDIISGQVLELPEDKPRSKFANSCLTFSKGDMAIYLLIRTTNVTMAKP